MSALSTVITGNSLPALKTNVDAFFAVNLSIRILSISFIAREKLSTPSLEMSVAILYDGDGATLAAPYVSTLLQGLGAGNLSTVVSAFLATVPTEFVRGPLTDWQGARHFQNPYTALMITNTSVTEGSANWLASPAQGLDSWQLDVSDSIAFSVGPAAGTILGAAAPAGGFQLIVNTLLHDAALDEGSYWKLPIVPASAGVDALSLNLKWTSTTAVVGDAVWGVAFAGIAGTDVITAETHDGFQRVTSTAAGAVNTVVEATIPLTAIQADSVRTGDYFQVLIARFGSDAADTLVGDASFIGAEIVFG